MNPLIYILFNTTGRWQHYLAVVAPVVVRAVQSTYSFLGRAQPHTHYASNPPGLKGRDKL